MAATGHPLEKVAEVRVLYADTDQMAVVNNMNYLRWFEIGRAEWIRARGQTYRSMEATGLMLPVVEAHVRYRAPARYDDLVEIHAGPRDSTQATVTFGYAIYDSADKRLLAEGWTRHASLGKDGRVRRFPLDVLRLLGFSQKGS